MIGVTPLATRSWPAITMGCPFDHAGAQGSQRLANATARPSPLPLNAPFSLIVEARPVAGEVTPATAKLDAMMPRRRNGMNRKSMVTQRDDGRWQADGCPLRMAASWRVEIEVETDGATNQLAQDRAVP